MTRCSSLAVVTIVRGRRLHLDRQRQWIRRYAPGVHHVIVDMGGAAVSDGPETIVGLPLPESAPLPLAAARNLGATHTRSDVIAFLDVDCLPTADLFVRYAEQVGRHDGVWAGPVGYLPPSAEIDDWSPAHLITRASFHDRRPQPGQRPGIEGDHDLFWSLSFAVGRRTWDRLGGFDERFVGYGAEDTDFGRQARALGLALWFDGWAIAFHQHHPVSSPPVEHLDDIVRNAALFHSKWGEWPMAAWLGEFAALDLIRWSPTAERIATRS